MNVIYLNNQLIFQSYMKANSLRKRPNVSKANKNFIFMYLQINTTTLNFRLLFLFILG